MKKHTICVIGILAALLSNNCLANLNGNDDFNDNSKDPSRWGADVIIRSGGVFTEVHQRLEYSTSGSGLDAVTLRPWALNGGSYGDNWEVQLDVTVPFIDVLNGQATGLGILVFAGDPLTNRFSIQLNDSSGHNFKGNFAASGVESPNVTVETAAASASLRVAFDARTKVLSCFYDETGPNDGYDWTLLRKEEVGTNWNLSSSSIFRVAMFATSKGVTVGASDNVFADNYCASSWSIPKIIQTNMVGSDNFNDNIKDDTRWSSDLANGVGVLTETNHHLEYTTIGTPTSSDLSARGWILNFGSYTADWRVQVDVNLPAFAATSGQGVQIGLAASVKGGDGSTRMSLFLGAGSEGRFIESNLDLNNARVGSQSMSTLSTSVALRLSWNAASQNLVAEYDEDGSNGGYHWQRLANWNISNGAFNWNMTSSSAFVIFVFGNSQSISIRSVDQVFADNFEAAPSLTITREGESTLLLWSTNAPGYTLESREPVSPGTNWASVASTPVIVADQNTVTDCTSSPTKLYRLRK